MEKNNVKQMEKDAKKNNRKHTISRLAREIMMQKSGISTIVECQAEAIAQLDGIVDNKKIYNHELNILLSIKDNALRNNNVDCASDILCTITKYFYPMSVLSYVCDGVASYFDTDRKVSVLARGKAYRSNII